MAVSTLAEGSGSAQRFGGFRCKREKELLGFPHDADGCVTDYVKDVVEYGFVFGWGWAGQDVFQSGYFVVHPYHEALPSKAADVFRAVITLLFDKCCVNRFGGEPFVAEGFSEFYGVATDDSPP